LSKVLSKANYDKVEPIIMYIDKNGQITPREAENICKKSSATVRRYLKLLVETGCIQAEGKTNNTIYKIADGQQG